MVIYELDAFRCHIKDVKFGNAVPAVKALVFDIKNDEGHHQIFFESDEALFECLKRIRDWQGVQDLRAEYHQLCLLGKGGFGKVILAQHKHSRVKVAIKLIDKKHLNAAYSNCGETFQEVKILQEVTNSGCRNVL